MSKVDWQKLQEFQNEHKDLLIMVASPEEDAISITFGGLGTFVRFFMESMDKGVVFNVLRESKFKESIDIFISKVAESMGISTINKSSNELLKLIGGSIKSIGIARSKQLSVSKPKINAKSKTRK